MTPDGPWSAPPRGTALAKPVVLVTGVNAEAMAARSIALVWDLPRSVAVRHDIDVDRQVLTRVVSDSSGLVETVEIDLEHACVSCAIREDIIPTLERVATDGRWSSIVAHLPVGAEARQVCNVLAQQTRLARHLRVASVVVAVSGPRLESDLFGDDLLCERDLHSSHEDSRSVGETLAAMVEYADVVAVLDATSPAGGELLTALARPDAMVLAEDEPVNAADVVLGTRHRTSRSESWVAPDRRGPLPPLALQHSWRMDLISKSAFHPERLWNRLEELGVGAHRSRGCFWLPTRSDRLCEWDGAGGQLSIGTGAPWRPREWLTRIVLVGPGTRPGHLKRVFDSLLVTEREARVHGPFWESVEDGFEPWLGPIRRIA